MPGSVFINYSHPLDQGKRQNRRVVASYIGTHYRNRSKPSARKVSKNEEFIEETFRGQPSHTRGSSVRHSMCLTPDSAYSPIPHDSHGYRSDPFTAYPIEFRACIPAAIDFFLGFYGPAHIIRPEVLSAKAGKLMLQQYFQYALQSSLMFEAIVALAQANLTITSWTFRGPDRDALYHYSRALHRLRMLLVKQRDHPNDSVLFAIIALMGVDYLLNDMIAFETHLGGLRRIVALRGGLDQLGWPMVLKPYLVGMESFWAYMSKHKDVKSGAMGQISPEGVAPQQLHCSLSRELVTELSLMIATIPLGFRALASESRISLPVIALIHKVKTTAPFINQVRRVKIGTEINAANLQEAEHCVRLLACPDLTDIDRACCIGVLVAILDSTRSERFSPLYARQIQHHSAELLRWQANIDSNDLEDLFLWVGLDVVGTMFPPRVILAPVHYHLDKRYELLMALMERYRGLVWKHIELIMTRFFFTPSCLRSWENAWSFGLEEVAAKEATWDRPEVCAKPTQSPHNTTTCLSLSA